ncbi:MAG TPA: hypothetical protein VMW87_04600 [Spirochaetia bacterium]|nr:hypothetical protein [Spirochaetia bacterium]
MPRSIPRFPNKLLVFGVLFLVIGFVLLLRTLGYVPQFTALWPLFFFGCGMAMLYMVFVLKRGAESYVFLGMFLGLGGLFLFLMTTVMNTVGLERIWPVFMTIAGMSLGAYGMVKKGYARLSMVIPGVTIIALSLVFMPFSLGYVKQSFRGFVGEWWPSLFLLLGVVLIFVYAYRRRRRQRRPR